VAAGPAGPDPKARHVTAEKCRAILQQPSLTDEEAEKLLDHFYLVADVVVDAFKEQRGRTHNNAENTEYAPLPELGNEIKLASVIHAV
jgi:hypothetical protein